MIDDDIRQRRFDEAPVRSVLDRMGVADLISMFGDPVWVRNYHQSTTHWKPGDDRPALASDDPSVMQAIGRCAVGRIAPPKGLSTPASIHDVSRCGWCEYPVDELLKACEWAQYQAMYLTAEMIVWHEDPVKRRGARYIRWMRGDQYTGTTYSEYFARPHYDREEDVRVGLYGEKS